MVVLTHTKITLSPDELQLAQNSQWILTKRAIIDKTVLLFSRCCDNMRDIVEAEKACLTHEAFLSEPKISKGENYRQLPYVILDYPRNFAGGNVFAIRTMFWWGNFFSITLHLAGEHKKIFHEDMDRKISLLRKKEYYLCINEDQWQHHFEADNYIPVKQLSQKELHAIILKSKFVKLAVKFPLQQWNDVPVLLDESFAVIIKMLKD